MSTMSSGTILVVEDDTTLQSVVSHALSSFGFDAVAVSSGEEAVAVDTSELVLIFMDVTLPGMNGKEATTIIRKNEVRHGRHHVPIIALTAHSDREECVRAGMDDFLQKPALLEDLYGAIERWNTASAAK